MKYATGEPSSGAEDKPLVVLPQHRRIGGEPRAPHIVPRYHHLPELYFLSQVSVLGDPLSRLYTDHHWS
jgi:hypothetical protein